LKQIPLTQGLFALVDDADFEELNQFKWHAHKHGRTVYAMRNVPTGLARPKQRQLRMHKEIAGTPAGYDTDHVDGNGLNNQRHNLRVVPHRLNSFNQQHKAEDCTSQYRGVTWNKQKKSWRARIQADGVSRDLGHFKSEEDAARAYDRAGFERDPEHFTPNFPRT
jgi:hypothetical protein